MQKLIAGMLTLALLGGSAVSHRMQAARATCIGTTDTRNSLLINNLARLTLQTTP
jgi:hypothetical protein